MGELNQDERTRGELASQYRTLLETSTDGFFINVGGRFVFVNPALQRLLGADSADELLGREVFDFIDPDSHDAVRERIRAMKSSTDPVAPLEEKYVRLDGSLVDVEVTAVAIVHGGEHAMLVTLRDISERRKAEEDRALLEEQLLHAQKLDALGTLAGGIAHDFNNVLVAIAGNADLLEMRLGDASELASYLDDIRAAVTRAEGLTRQILTFSRRQEPQLRAIDLAGVVEEELPLLRAALPVGASIETRLAPGPHPVQADPNQMHQVLLNLCTNAWQSFDGGPGRVTIGLQRVDVPEGEQTAPGGSPGAHVVLSVEDDGPGIDEEIASRIFDPFFTTKEPGEGTGLGLSVVHGIAESHRARITCDPNPSGGTIFRLFLPLAGQAESRSSESTTVAPRGHGEHVLLLDDEPSLVRVGEEILTAQGYRVSAFTSPFEAIDALNERSAEFDLLVTDLKMAGKTGIDVARVARSLDPPLPVILISGFLEDEVRRQARELDVHRVLHKPVPTAELCLAIAEALAPEA